MTPGRLTPTRERIWPSLRTVADAESAVVEVTERETAPSSRRMMSPSERTVPMEGRVRLMWKESERSEEERTVTVEPVVREVVPARWCCGVGG